ncbi:MAG: N-acetyltransferase, partial [Frankiaceae bacterium]|nr:N-acetyltransferase [Frankiaceae bacterium]
ECKLLLLTHAFEDCGFGRVKIQTDLVNTRSQAAIAKLGATREGVLRRHIKRADGSFRDTVVFAVTIDDWPVVRAGLEARLVKG